mgnify:CR=1 FL=1
MLWHYRKKIVTMPKNIFCTGKEPVYRASDIRSRSIGMVRPTACPSSKVFESVKFQLTLHKVIFFLYCARHQGIFLQTARFKESIAINLY